MKRWSCKKSIDLEVAEIDLFIKDIIAVYKKHNLSLGHEDGHGSFLVECMSESNIAWLEQACDDRK